jgi:hypothetical protein
MAVFPTFLLFFFAALASAQCPPVHVFGARETTAPPGLGSAAPVVDSVLNAVPGSTAEVINYPACGGQDTCGGVNYNQSVIDGVNAVMTQVDTFNEQCPETLLVLIGYSQVRSTYDCPPRPRRRRLAGRTDFRRRILRGWRHERRARGHRHSHFDRRTGQGRGGNLLRRPAPHPRPELQRRNVRGIRGLSSCSVLRAPLADSSLVVASLRRVRPAFCVRSQIGSSRTATRQTRSAATGTTRPSTRATLPNTAPWRSSLSLGNLARLEREARRPLGEEDGAEEDTSACIVA